MTKAARWNIVEEGSPNPLITVADARKIVGLFGDSTYDPQLLRHIDHIKGLIENYLRIPVYDNAQCVAWYRDISARLEIPLNASTETADKPKVEYLCDGKESAGWKRISPLPASWLDDSGHAPALVFPNGKPNIKVSTLAALPVRVNFTFAQPAKALSAIETAMTDLLIDSWRRGPSGESVEIRDSVWTNVRQTLSPYQAITP